MAPNPKLGIRSHDEAEQSQVQRPQFNPTDPRGGFDNNPEFKVMGIIDNGGCHSTESGTTRNPFVGEET